MSNRSFSIEQSAEDLYDNAPCGYFTTLPNNLIIKVNNTFSQWTGYGKEEIEQNKRFQDLLSIGSKIYFETHYEPLLRMQKNIREINFELHTKEGKKIPVLINSSIVEDKNGKEIFSRSIVFDITQRKLYERELLLEKKRAEELVEILAKKNSALEQFAKVLSHDLQDPLQAISFFAELIELKNKDVLNDESKKFIQNITQNVKDMSGLIKDLLEYSSSTYTDLEMAEVDLNDVLEYVKRIFSKSIQSKEAKIIIPQLPPVKGYRNQIVRLFQNLLSNSLKYKGEADPVIEISYNDEGDFFKFFFKDNGKGFDQEKAEEVFEFSSRLEIDKEITGHGIGLASCRKIVEMHNGYIGVESSEGKGSIFYFTLPKN